MLFSNNEFLQLRLRMARFVGTIRMSLSTTSVSRGDFFALLDAGMAFFFKHLIPNWGND